MMSNHDKSLEEARLRQFEVVAFGCHERAHQRLTNFFRSQRECIQTYLFVEYFCVEPVPLALVQETWAETKLFFPFIRRHVEANQFLWICEEDGRTFKLLPKTTAVTKHFDDAATFCSPVSYAKIGSDALNWWKIHGSPKTRREADEPPRPPILRFTSQQWTEYLEFIRTAPGADRDLLLREFGLIGQSWVGNRNHSLIFGFPIATDAIFYGYFMLILPGQSDAEMENTIREDALDELCRLAKNLYLPVLTILAESLLEKKLSKQIRQAEKEGRDWKQIVEDFIVPYEVPFFCCNTESDPTVNKHKDCPTPDRPYAADIEAALHQLWLRRKVMLSRVSDSEAGRWTFLNTLAFGEYFVASPGLIKQLTRVIATNLTMPGERKSLPAALVYGGPGSGKDVLARLVPLFSSDYFFSEVYTINMASLRPDAITGPLFQGVRLAYSSAPEQGPSQMLGLEGLLVEAKRRAMVRNKDQDRDKNGATFILDELNSLDIDLQGILLRILEQGEVMPLFGLEREYVQHLIIGVVNEDPEEISRESELRELLVEKGRLGTIISGLIYETLRRTRRLREDLYYRLKRQLYVRAPEMKERREDIPMLFYLFASQEAEGAEIRKLIVELNAYRLLMHPQIPWPGNIRQVQSVARRSVREAREKPILTKEDNALIVLYGHVLTAVRDEFKGIRLHTEDEEICEATD